MRDCRSAIIYVNNEMVQFFVIQFEKKSSVVIFLVTIMSLLQQMTIESGVSIQVHFKEIGLRLPFTPEWGVYLPKKGQNANSAGAE